MKNNLKVLKTNYHLINKIIVFQVLNNNNNNNKHIKQEHRINFKIM